MSVNALLEIDARIAKLRQQMAEHKATLSTGTELDELLQKRAALLAQTAKEQERRVQNPI